MRERTLLIALTLLTAAFAGCVGGSDDAGSDVDTASTDDGDVGQTQANETNETSETDEVDQTGPDLNVTVVNGTMRGGSVPTGWYCEPGSPCENDYDLEVTNATTAVLIELAWEASTEMYTDMDVPFEHCEPQTPVGIYYSCPNPGTESGQSPLVIEVTDPEMLENTGTWDGDIWVESNTPTTVEYTLYITIAEGDPLPNGYSNVQR